jgi:hypothetical protein
MPAAAKERWWTAIYRSANTLENHPNEGHELFTFQACLVGHDM